MTKTKMPVEPPALLRAGDALVIVDVQNDFCPGGALAVPEGDRIIPVLNTWIEAAENAGVPVFVSRDWHPEDHVSFSARGGPWPPHCIQGTVGAEFHPLLELPHTVEIVGKASHPDRDSYSAFGGTDFETRLRARGVGRLWIGGLAQDYCVKQTALDGVRLGFEVRLISGATRAVEVHPGDGARALEEMRQAGVLIEPMETEN